MPKSSYKETTYCDLP